MTRFSRLAAGVGAAGAFAGAGTSGAAPAASGLALRLEGGGSLDQVVASNVWLHVAPDAAPNPFVPAGAFTATWTGTVTVDLRGDYQFRAEFAGDFSLDLNGTNILRSTGASGVTEWSPPVRLKKGANSLRATLARAGAHEARARVLWQGRGVSAQSIPLSALAPGPSSDPNTGSAAAEARHLGRDLFLTRRCGKCHPPATYTPVPELAMDAPSFEGIGSRRRADWLARWVADPSAARPNATMPRLLHGPRAADDARAIAAWLSTLTSPPPSRTWPKGNPAVGRSLFNALQCSACHVLPAQADEPDKFPLRSVGSGFMDGALPAYLEKPERHFEWNPMPNFHLTAEEAAHLAVALLEQAPPPADIEAAFSAASVVRGRELAQSLGCLNCHPAPVDNRFAVKPLRELPASAWDRGCLAENPGADAPAPRYRLTAEERTALRTFGAEGGDSLGRHVPADFADRWTRALRCQTCHDTVGGIPRPDSVGDKLRPEWMAQLFEGGVGYKPRRWLPARMPAFPAFGVHLAAGLAATRGLPPRSPQEPPIDPQAAEDGRKLISASGGFSCVSCHAVGPLDATAVFEAPGVNLAHTGERLLPEYFVRWVTNPQSIDPATRMPLYFDEDGNSALTDYFGGDGPKTIHALWDYVRLGSKMVPPAP